MNPSTIICPNCKHKFSPDEAFSHEVEEKIRQSLRDEFNKKYLDEKKKLEEKIEEESAGELRLLKEQFERQKKELAQAHDYELELRKKTAELEEKGKNLELEKQRQIDEERKKIQEKTEAEVTEKFHLKEKDKDLIIENLKKSLDDAQRKVNQGSQQLQGEVQELEIARMLKESFPFDEIIEIKTGANGADILQIIRNENARECGSLLWESKRTKDWQNPWIQKLKDDKRKSKADIGIIVSDNLPKGISNFGPLEGVFVTSFSLFIALAQIMRIKIIDMFYAKASLEGKNDKKEVLWQYLTGNEFKQRVEVILDYFKKRRDQLDKEKKYFNAKWSEEEKSIELVVTQTAGMYGDLKGLMSGSLPQIASLEITTESLEQTDPGQVYIRESTIVADNISQIGVDEV